jgi:hypothetical protein
MSGFWHFAQTQPDYAFMGLVVVAITLVNVCKYLSRIGRK